MPEPAVSRLLKKQNKKQNTAVVELKTQTVIKDVSRDNPPISPATENSFYSKREQLLKMEKMFLVSS